MAPRARHVLLVRVAHPAVAAVRHPIAPLPPFGLKYLQAALAQSGTRVTLIDGLASPPDASDVRLRRVLDAAPPSAVVLDATCGAGSAARALAGLCVSTGVPAVYLGGADPEMTGDAGREVAPFAAVAGVELDTALAPHLFPDGGHDGEPPVPRYTAAEMRTYRPLYTPHLAVRARYGNVLASRGCPHRCGFCTPALRVSSGRKLRLRRVDDVAAEIALRRREEGATVIRFGDEDLTADPAWAAALADRLAAERDPAPFIAHARVDEVDRALIGLLARAGCAMLLFGVESAVPSVLETLKKCRDPDGWVARAEAVFAWCREAGIATHAMFIIGTPGEGAADIERSWRLARRLRADSLQVHFFTAYPGNTVAASRAGAPLHARAHYDAAGATPALPAASLKAWRRRFYRLMYGSPAWWRDAAHTLPRFAAHNPDIALALIWRTLGTD